MELDEKRDLEALPEWVPMYLDCWGSVKPDRGRMTVSFAAEFAGTTPEAVRHLRVRSAAFRRMEDIARHGTALWAQSYVEAGLRNRLPAIFAAIDKLLAGADRDTALKLLGWERGKPEEIKVSGDLGISDLREFEQMSDEELARFLANLEVAEGRISEALRAELGLNGPRPKR
jgi:hypothetical protein